MRIESWLSIIYRLTTVLVVGGVLIAVFFAFLGSGYSLVFSQSAFPPTGVASNQNQPNVLLIIVDDLRAELNDYTQPPVRTPHINKLSEEGITFLNAYCQKAICVPSRQSFLTGMRPDSFGAGFNNHFRKRLPDHSTLPQQFKQHGYRTESVGKVFHHRDSISWNAPSWVPTPELSYPIYRTEENLAVQRDRIARGEYFPKDSLWWASGGKWVPAGVWEAPDVADDQLTDGVIASYALERFRALKDTTFFMAVGFFRPHIPFIAPQKYYDLYPLNSINLPTDSLLPLDAPSVAKNDRGEWRKYHQVPAQGMPNKITQREYIRGYLASVSYVDAQIGRLLNGLDELGLQDNTIVVLMSDHGYHLFDKASFGKKTNYEGSTRVPLIMKAPSLSRGGVETNYLLELIDLYPTLCDLADIPVPSSLPGTSFAEALQKPDLPGKQAAYSQFFRQGFRGNSVRTNRYRYTAWTGKDTTHYELYDYLRNPEETYNKIDEPSYQGQITILSDLLHEVFE